MKLQPAVYILTNQTNTVLYTGVTSALINRVFQHKNNQVAGFTQKYHVHKLVYYELHDTMENAIKREKQIKNLVRRKKIELITKCNPTWKDLYEEII